MKRKSMAVIGMVVGCLMMVAGAAWAGSGGGHLIENGTYKDGNLVWLKNADCYEKMDWVQATATANNLKSGDCGLTDGSKAGAWRLPTKNELNGLVNGTNETELKLGNFGYWSSTMGWYAGDTSTVMDPSTAVLCYMHIGWGNKTDWPKVKSGYVLPVRSGP